MGNTFHFCFSINIFRPLDIATLSGETVELSLRSEFNEDAAWKTVGQQETDSSGRCSFQLDSETIARCGIYKARFTVLGDGSQVTKGIVNLLELLLGPIKIDHKQAECQMLYIFY